MSVFVSFVDIIIKLCLNVVSITPLGLSCAVSIWNNQVIDVQLPQQVEYVVVECPPNFKGNTAQGATKPAVLDSGATVNVPMFIEQGERIIVTTADVKYVSRASKGN